VDGCMPRGNDSCANAIDVSGMQDVSGSTLGAANDVEPPASCTSAAGRGGADVFYKLTLTQPEWVGLDTFGSAINTVLYVLDGCGGNVLSQGSACDDDSNCNPPDQQTSALALHLGPGTYIIVVDSFGPGGAGAFTLHVRRSGPSCESATPITLGTPVTGTTAGQPNRVNPIGCGMTTSSGPDQLYFFYLCPIAGTFSVEARTCGATSFDSVVYLRYGTCTANELGCDDDGCGTGGGPSDLNAQNIATGGGLYFVVVDGYGPADAGSFTLLVR
jgi:hypothetical protein